MQSKSANEFSSQITGGGHSNWRHLLRNCGLRGTGEPVTRIGPGQRHRMNGFQTNRRVDAPRAGKVSTASAGCCALRRAFGEGLCRSALENCHCGRYYWQQLPVGASRADGGFIYARPVRSCLLSFSGAPVAGRCFQTGPVLFRWQQGARAGGQEQPTLMLTNCVVSDTDIS